MQDTVKQQVEEDKKQEISGYKKQVRGIRGCQDVSMGVSCGAELCVCTKQTEGERERERKHVF